MLACSNRFLYELEASGAHIYVILHAPILTSIFPLARHAWLSSLTTYGGAIRAVSFAVTLDKIVANKSCKVQCRTLSNYIPSIVKSQMAIRHQLHCSIFWNYIKILQCIVILTICIRITI